MSLHHVKIWDPQALHTHIQLLRSQNPAIRIVFTNGCFDLLHPGHVDLLQRAKTHGNILILGLNTDASVRRLGKGYFPQERPIQSFATRAFMAAQLNSVDYITHFDTDTPLELITLLQPDVLIKGGDWPVPSIIGSESVLARGGEVFSLPLVDGFSTTLTIAKIRNE